MNSRHACSAGQRRARRAALAALATVKSMILRMEEAEELDLLDQVVRWQSTWGKGDAREYDDGVGD